MLLSPQEELLNKKGSFRGFIEGYPKGLIGFLWISKGMRVWATKV